MNFDLKNSWKNEFKDNKEKSCSWSRKRVSHKIDFKAVGPRNGHADSVGVNDLKKLISTNWSKIHNKKSVLLQFVSHITYETSDEHFLKFS